MLSVSTLTSYFYCARKLYLQYVLKFREPLKDVIVKGSIRHKIYEDINNKEEQIITSVTEKKTLEQLQEIYKKYYKEIVITAIRDSRNQLDMFNIPPNDMYKQTWPLILEESITRASNLHQFMQLHLVYGQKLWEKLTPKIKSEVKIDSKKLNIRGIIDQLEIYERGFVPIEIKTGSCPKDGVWPNHRIQLVAYVMLLEDKFNVEIKEGFIHYLDAKQRRHIAINPFMRQEIKDTIKRINALLTSKKLPDKEQNKNKCNKCGLKEICFNEALLSKKLNQLLKND